MSLIDQMWNHVQATEAQRTVAPPPGASNLWRDLNEAKQQLHTQAAEISELREALNYLAGVVEQLKGGTK